MYEYIRPLTSDEIYHHGILGQKWGKRNGPPYPLGVSNHSASEKKAGWKKSLDGKNPEEYNRSSKSNRSWKNPLNNAKKPDTSKSDHKGLTDKQKRAIKIGMAAVAATLVVGGSLYMVKHSDIDGPLLEGVKTKLSLAYSNSNLFLKTNNLMAQEQRIEHGSIFLHYDTLSHVGKFDYDSSYAFDPNSIVERISHINPTDSKYNCGSCAIASFLNSFGFNFKSIDSGKNGLMPFQLIAPFKDAHIERLKGDSSEDFMKHIQSQGNGAAGILYGYYKGDSFGHYLAYRVYEGTVHLLDGQAGSIVSTDWVLENFRSNSLRFSRLDGLDVDLTLLSKLVRQ